MSDTLRMTYEDCIDERSQAAAESLGKLVSKGFMSAVAELPPDEAREVADQVIHREVIANG